MNHLTRRTLFSSGLAVLAVGALSACSPAQSGSKTVSGSTSGSGQGTAITHVHAIRRDPASGDVLLATHQGLFRLSGGQLQQVGPVADFMGFTINPQGHYLASGHPATGTNLPQPLGLVTSTDQGNSWQVLSRGGESDFHALDAGPHGILAYDGQLRFSPDGKTWKSLEIPQPPASLATSPKTGTVLATTETGLMRSTDNGASWANIKTPHLTQYVAWVDDTNAVGVSTEGHVLTSTDAGKTWTSGNQPTGAATAMGASKTSDGKTEVLLVVKTAVLSTTDMGATTTQLL